MDDEIAAVVDYSINGSAISFTHTYTAPPRRGQGLAGEIVTFAVDHVEETTDLRIVPMCWYVSDWFEKNPDRAELLTR